MDYKKYAEMLYTAEKSCSPVSMLTEQEPSMSVREAYLIQLENVKKRKAAGEKVVGMKIGLTSRAMQELMGVDQPDYGHLFENMLLSEGEPCRMSELIQPKVEGELSFCLYKTLKGPGVTVADVYNATKYIVPSIEIIDSRIRDWKIKLQDTVADNGSAARFVMGNQRVPVETVDMRLTGMTMEKNGVLINSGAVAEVMGNPAAAVASIANMLAEYDIALEAGSIVMAGAVTAAVPVQAGDIVTAAFQGIGAVSVKFI